MLLLFYSYLFIYTPVIAWERVGKTDKSLEPIAYKQCITFCKWIDVTGVSIELRNRVLVVTYYFKLYLPDEAGILVI
jgi:hypothetical protein